LVRKGICGSEQLVTPGTDCKDLVGLVIGSGMYKMSFIRMEGDLHRDRALTKRSWNRGEMQVNKQIGPCIFAQGQPRL
jgi:hypothetical protein